MKLIRFNNAFKKLVLVALIVLGVTNTANANDVSVAESRTGAKNSSGWVSINAQEIGKLKKLMKKDPAVKLFLQQEIARAKEYQNQPPNPIERIRSEGVLQGDPAKEATLVSLKDMEKMKAMTVAYVITKNKSFLLAVKNYLLAWAETNKPEGNPVNDHRLEGLIFSYDVVRTKIPDAQPKIDAWLREVARSLIASRNMALSTATSNWHSHRIKIVGLIGFTLKDQALIDYTVSSYRQQIQDNLFPDGTSDDFVRRDALHYHSFTLESLLTIAIAANRYGEDLYHYEAPSGSSLAKSIAFLLPYVKGEKTHGEYVNSKIAFDRKRANNNEPKFKIGRLYEPVEAITVLDLAAYFDSSLTPLRYTIKSDTSYRLVLNEVQK